VPWLSDGTSLPYDHLVLSPGVVGDPSGIPGMSDALDMYSFDDVSRQEAAGAGTLTPVHHFLISSQLSQLSTQAVVYL